MIEWVRHEYRGWVCKSCGYHAKFIAGMKVHERRGCSNRDQEQPRASWQKSYRKPKKYETGWKAI